MVNRINPDDKARSGQKVKTQKNSVIIMVKTKPWVYIFLTERLFCQILNQKDKRVIVPKISIASQRCNPTIKYKSKIITNEKKTEIKKAIVIILKIIKE